MNYGVAINILLNVQSFEVQCRDRCTISQRGHLHLKNRHLNEMKHEERLANMILMDWRSWIRTDHGWQSKTAII